MKGLRRIYSVLLVCTITITVQAGPVVEKPAVMPEAMISITVPDLHGFIDGFGGVAANIQPMMNGMMLKNMIGMQIGDPGLAGIAPGKGLAVVALDTTNFFGLVEVSEAQLGGYTNMLASKGMQFRYADGALIVGQTADQVAKGSGMVKTVQSSLLTKRTPDLRVAMQPAALIERNDQQIQGLLQMMPVIMGQGMMQAPGATLDSTQATLKVLEGELRLLLSIASQCDVAEVVFAPKGGSLRISETFVPKAETRLATLCSAPSLSTPNAKIQAGYFDKAAIAFDSHMANPQALMDFMVAEAALLDEQMNLTDVDLPAAVSGCGKYWRIMKGSMSETVDFGMETGLNVGYLMDVKDETEAMEILRNLSADMAGFLELYDSMGIGMTMEFKENVRKYKDNDIHQFKMTMAMKDQPDEVAAQMAAMNMTNMVYDVAIVDGIMIYAMGNVKIDTVIDRLGDASFKPMPVKARSVYPEGGTYYLDLDMGKYMAFAAAFMPDAGNAMVKQQMTTLFQGVEPLTSAGYKKDNRVMWSINIPGELIAKFGQFAMMMQMQQMQQQQQMGAPQGMPGAAPVDAPEPSADQIP